MTIHNRTFHIGYYVHVCASLQMTNPNIVTTLKLCLAILTGFSALVTYYPEVMRYRLLLSTAAFLAAAVGAIAIYRSNLKSSNLANVELNSIVNTEVVITRKSCICSAVTSFSDI